MPAELLHFSEDPDVARFVPRVAPTASDVTPLVWAVDEARAPAYWFPRDCPRVTAWVEPGTTAADRARVLGGAPRVHAIEYRWLAPLTAARLFVYSFDARDFRPYGDPAYAFVCDRTVEPLAPPRPLGDLLGLHERAGIELRLTDDLGPWWRAVSTSSCGFSGIRLRNATGPGRGSSR